jgi:hypothetical protein
MCRYSHPFSDDVTTKAGQCSFISRTNSKSLNCDVYVENSYGMLWCKVGIWSFCSERLCNTRRHVTQMLLNVVSVFLLTMMIILYRANGKQSHELDALRSKLKNTWKL